MGDSENIVFTDGKINYLSSFIIIFAVFNFELTES